MQIFANGKRRFHSFMELYVICSKNQGAGFVQVMENLESHGIL